MRKLPNISASSIKALKKCPMSWYLAYVQGIREDETADVLRIGTHWHKMMEILREGDAAINPETGTTAVEAALAYLNDAYVGLDFSLEAERAMLAYSFLGYVWRYQNETVQTDETEFRFRIPFGDADVVGVIDRLITTPSGRKLGYEYKTTGQDIGPSEDYWRNLNMDTQPRMYVWAARRLDRPIDGIYYDVFHKPGIRPRMLSAADTKKFLDSLTYYDTVFDIQGEVDPGTLSVDGTKVEVKWNKAGKSFAIRETVEMYGARLLSLIYADPDKYFQRKEIVITDEELAEFELELTALYYQMNTLMDAQHVYKNEGACDSPYRCPFQNICYYRRNKAVVAGETPTGYKRIRLTYGATQ